MSAPRCLSYDDPLTVGTETWKWNASKYNKRVAQDRKGSTRSIPKCDILTHLTNRLVKNPGAFAYVLFLPLLLFTAALPPTNQLVDVR